MVKQCIINTTNKWRLDLYSEADVWMDDVIPTKFTSSSTWRVVKHEKAFNSSRIEFHRRAHVVNACLTATGSDNLSRHITVVYTTWATRSHQIARNNYNGTTAF